MFENKSQGLKNGPYATSLSLLSPPSRRGLPKNLIYPENKKKTHSIN
jgi:hypothetical protein